MRTPILCYDWLVNRNIKETKPNILQQGQEEAAGRRNSNPLLFNLQENKKIFFKKVTPVTLFSQLLTDKSPVPMLGEIGNHTK